MPGRSACHRRHDRGKQSRKKTEKSRKKAPQGSPLAKRRPELESIISDGHSKKEIVGRGDYEYASHYGDAEPSSWSWLFYRMGMRRVIPSTSRIAERSPVRGAAENVWRCGGLFIGDGIKRYDPEDFTSGRIGFSTSSIPTMWTRSSRKPG